MKVYVASSWRCKYQPSVVELLLEHRLDVYDFRNPGPGEHGFRWSETALRECDACLCVLPCGRSAHLELGWACGAGKLTAIYMPPEEKHEPELMYKALGSILVDEIELNKWAREIGL